MTALISKRGSNKAGRDVAVVFGVELKDAREEVFVILVCDGLPMGLAFKRAGFESKAHDAPSNLFNLPRVQERARAILDARKAAGPVTLPEVTTMLQRVFAGAHSEGEYSAAHNAAFSLARLYGHVTDKSTLEVIRRPSRDPDAPSEQMLEAWAASLPVVSGPGPEAGLEGPNRDAPANLLGPDDTSRPEPSGLGLFNDINELSRPSDGEGETGNGAPVGPVTMTPNSGGPSPLLEKGAPDDKMRVPVKIREIPSFEELFGE